MCEAVAMFELDEEGIEATGGRKVRKRKVHASVSHLHTLELPTFSINTANGWIIFMTTYNIHSQAIRYDS